MRNEDISVIPAADADKKRAVILDMVFSEGSLGVDVILEKNGIDRGEFAEWLRDDGFYSDLCGLAARVGEAEMSRVSRCLIELAKGGDVKAAKVIRSVLCDGGGQTGENEKKLYDTAQKYKMLDREIFGETSE